MWLITLLDIAYMMPRIKLTLFRNRMIYSVRRNNALLKVKKIYYGKLFLCGLSTALPSSKR